MTHPNRGRYDGGVESPRREHAASGWAIGRCPHRVSQQVWWATDRIIDEGGGMHPIGKLGTREVAYMLTHNTRLQKFM